MKLEEKTAVLCSVDLRLHIYFFQKKSVVVPSGLAWRDGIIRLTFPSMAVKREMVPSADVSFPDRAVDVCRRAELSGKSSCEPAGASSGIRSQEPTVLGWWYSEPCWPREGTAGALLSMQ